MSNSGYQVTDYFVEKVIKHFTKTATYSTPPNLYMALTSQGTELDENSYGRAAIKFGTAKSLDNDGTSEVKNLEEVLFTTDTGTWSADGFAIYDAQTSGNRMFNGDFADAIEVSASETLKIEKEYLRLSLGLDHWTTEAQERALNLAFAGGSYQPSGLYVALLKSEPDFSKKSSALDELSGGGYSRVQVETPWTYGGPYASSDDKATFGAATADWGQFVASALVDAQQGGVVIGWATNEAIEVLNGDVVEISAGLASLAF